MDGILSMGDLIKIFFTVVSATVLVLVVGGVIKRD